MSLLSVPKGVIAKIVAMQRQFFWSGETGKKSFPLVAWSTIELPKNLGGLGVGNLLHRNIAILFKWWWRYLSEPNALWHKVIQAKYGYSPHTTTSDFLIPKNGGLWKGICASIIQHPIAKKPCKIKCKEVGWEWLINSFLNRHLGGPHSPKRSLPPPLPDLQ